MYLHVACLDHGLGLRLRVLVLFNNNDQITLIIFSWMFYLYGLTHGCYTFLVKYSVLYCSAVTEGPDLLVNGS